LRIAIATVQVPFIRGGAELLALGLLEACRNAGHAADIIAIPFRYGPNKEVRRSMDLWASEDFTQLNGYCPDTVICLKFPAYYLQHPDKCLWLLHQHRDAYDLWRENAGISTALQSHIHQQDTEQLSKIKRRYTIARNVSKRLFHYNKLDSQAVYHPPHMADEYYTRPPMPYIFCPSRLEQLKRQNLLIEAMRYVRSPLKALIAGTGGQQQYYARLIEQYGLSEKVRLLGEVGIDELLALYANCLAVFFGPMDEDYGYVTLEAMLAAKPVITCSDSGGPLEFVEHGISGFVSNPHPEEIAEAIETLSNKKATAEQMGRAGLEAYRRMGISWDNVLDTLLKSPREH
jgi:glycosyltransferase involved in cell wall biosynthesis